MSKTILLVDDDQRLRNLLKDYLKEKDFKVYTSQDFIEAKKWFQKSVEQGNIQSMQLLSTMLILGRGTEIDFLRGYVWASIASENNDKNSLLILSELQKEMTDLQIKEAKELTMKCKKNKFLGC